MKFTIPEVKEEEFFEEHFEYGDDNDTVVSNFKTSLNLFGKAYKETLKFGEMAENGEVFESETVAKAFSVLALSYRFCLEFATQMDEPVKIQVVSGAVAGSFQEYVNAFLKKLFANA